MEFAEVKAKFDQKIEEFLNRTRINHIVCVSPLHTDGKSWTEIECEKYLKKSHNNKLAVSNIFLLNDHTNSAIQFQHDESNELKKALKECALFFTDEILEFCKHGENQYELNQLIRNAFLLIDASIVNMNYNSWLTEISTNNPEDTFFLLIGNKKIPKRCVIIDTETYCSHLIKHEFAFREILLYRLKNYLIDIYSTYLLLPAIEVIPKIRYTCNHTDICELLMAIGYTNEITDSEKLKAILMEMFGISQKAYNKASYEIRNRKSSNSVFVKKLSDNLDKTLPTWKDPNH